MARLDRQSQLILQARTFSHPDEARTFDQGRAERVTLGEVTFERSVLEPGWRWSRSVGQAEGLQTCEATHVRYHVSGRMRIAMDDGTEHEFGPGDLSMVPPGHDGWVVGNEPVVVIEILRRTPEARVQPGQPSRRRAALPGRDATTGS